MIIFIHYITINNISWNNGNNIELKENFKSLNVFNNDSLLLLRSQLLFEFCEVCLILFLFLIFFFK